MLLAALDTATSIQDMEVSWPRISVETVSRPRINDLVRGRVSRFSLDALVNIATALGLRVHLEVGAA